MSTLTLKGLTSGSSVLKAPDSGSNEVTFTMPASAGTVLSDASTLDATKLSGNLPAIDGSNLTSLPQSFTGAVTATTDMVVHAGGAARKMFMGVSADDLAFGTYSSSNTVRNEHLKITSGGRGLSQFTAKVWARFNGSGTPAFGDSHNCSSITDNSTGNYTINFTNNLANVNYSLTTASQNWSIASNEWRLVSPYSMAVGSVGIQTVESYGGDLRLVDHTECMLQIFGD
tara:strand:+ start:989 stop:1675 length:687 start_codon:yes stop_codon:yes gene_type:complete